MNHFDAQAKTWDDNPEKLLRANIFAEAIANHIQPNGTEHALEFGCGTGLLSFALKDAFKTLTLVDTSLGMIEVLREKIKAQKIDHFKPMHIDLLKKGFDIMKAIITFFDN